MTFRELTEQVSSDLYRYTGRNGAIPFLSSYFTIPGFKFTFFLRFTNYLSKGKVTRLSLYLIARLFLNYYKYKFGYDIHPATVIGRGFYIGHFGCIVVNHRSIIGKNCNISQGVTLGQINRGKKAGCPVIGDSVYIGPGVKIIGNIRIGSNVAIGANCVVTTDIPDNAVVVGIPGKVVSYDGSDAYVCNRV